MIDAQWINDYGMIRARLDGRGDGNLPLYTAITLAAIRLRADRDFASFGAQDSVFLAGGELEKWSQKLPGLFALHEIKPGLMRRTPTDPGQETWDNILGWISLAVTLRRPWFARRILRYALTHFFCFNTDGKLSKADFILNPHLWTLCVPAAYPVLRPMFKPILRFCARFLNANHPGGIMLDWTWVNTAWLMGAETGKLVSLTAKMPAALADQMDPEHPAAEFLRGVPWTQ